MEREPIDTRLKELNIQKSFWVEYRNIHQREVNKAQANIIVLSDSITALHVEEKTGSPLDVPPLHQSLKERVIQAVTDWIFEGNPNFK